MSGLIQNLLNQYPMEEVIVAESKSLYQGSVKDPISYDNGNIFWSERTNPSEWWQFTLLNKSAFVTSYRIKTHGSGSGGSHARSWIFSASNDNHSFVVIDIKIDNTQLDGANRDIIFNLPFESGPFSTFRLTIIRSHNTNSNYHYRLILNEFDIYGTLVDKKDSSDTCHCNFISHFSATILLTIIFSKLLFE